MNILFRVLFCNHFNRFASIAARLCSRGLVRWIIIMNIVTASRGTRGVYLIPEKKEYEASIKFIVALMCPVRDLRRQSHRRIHHSSLCGRYLPSSLFLFPSSSLPFLFIRPPCQVDSRSICLATDSNSSVHRRRSPLAKFPPCHRYAGVRHRSTGRRAVN